MIASTKRAGAFGMTFLWALVSHTAMMATRANGFICKVNRGAVRCSTTTQAIITTTPTRSRLPLIIEGKSKILFREDGRRQGRFLQPVVGSFTTTSSFFVGTNGGSSASHSLMRVALGMARGGGGGDEDDESFDNNVANGDNNININIGNADSARRNGMGMTPPNKGDLYSNDELLDLLQLHEGLSDQIMANNNRKESVLLPGEKAPEAGLPSLHDLVLQTVQEANNDDEDRHKTSGSDKSDKDGIQKRIQDIIAIASDVDGTLLTSDHKLHVKTEQAIRCAVQEVHRSSSATTNNSDNSVGGGTTLKYFFPATGKSRKGALDSLGPEIRELLSNLPGVFIQGLYCVDADGNTVFERKLSPKAIERAEELAERFGVTVLGYDGDCLYSNHAGDPQVCAEIHTKYGEPMPKVIPSLSAQHHSNGFHKLLLMHPNVDMLANEVRPDLQSLADDNEASVTTAIPTMLELLPEGCSKALGVEKLCNALGIDPGRQLLAIGDAENDCGMLEMAAIGVAVNNACDMA